MYVSCLGIYNEEDLKKAVALLKENGIEFTKGNPLSLFEQNEAEYRLTELYEVVDQNGNPAVITDELIADAANALEGGEYFDYDWLDELISRVLARNGLMFASDYEVSDDDDFDILKVGEKVMLPFGAGEDTELAKWLDQHIAPFEVVQVDKDNKKCWIKDCPCSISLDRVTVFQNIGF